jgi:hypothetical protein
MRACVRSWGTRSASGQANGVYDKPLDLRFCDYTDERINLKGKSLAAALMSENQSSTAPTCPKSSSCPKLTLSVQVSKVVRLFTLHCSLCIVSLHYTII